MFEDRGNRQLDLILPAKHLVDPGDEDRGQQRGAAALEEVIVDANAGQAEDLFPDCGYRLRKISGRLFSRVRRHVRVRRVRHGMVAAFRDFSVPWHA